MDSNKANTLVKKDFSVGYTLNGNQDFHINSYTLTNVVDGYRPLGIIQYVTNVSFIVPVNMSLADNDYGITLHNASTATWTSELIIVVLYQKR